MQERTTGAPRSSGTDPESADGQGVAFKRLSTTTRSDVEDRRFSTAESAQDDTKEDGGHQDEEVRALFRLRTHVSVSLCTSVCARARTVFAHQCCALNHDVATIMMFWCS